MSDRTPSVRSAIAEIEPYRSAQIPCSVKLNSNESPYPPPDDFLEGLNREIRELATHRYPDRSARALREGIAARHGGSVDEVLVGSGSNEVIQSLLLAYGGSGRRVGVFEPTYQVYSLIAAITGSETVSIERNENFEISEDAVDAMVAAAPDVVILCSPNNPTGNCDRDVTVRSLAGQLEGSLLIIDEAYAEFAPHDFGRLALESENVVSVRTFSKAWSLANLRLGYALAGAHLVEGASRVNLPYHVNGLSQIAGALALHFTPEMEERVARLIRERDRIFHGISATEGLVAFESNSNFILFGPVGAGLAAAVSQSERERLRDAAHHLWELLIDRDVLVRDCSTWSGVAGCLRVNAGTESENDAFLAALKWAVAQGA